MATDIAHEHAERTSWPTRSTGIGIDLSQRKHAEARLARLCRTLKAARVATFFWDTSARSVAWDDEAGLVFPGVSGVAFESGLAFIVGHVHPLARASAQSAIERAIAHHHSARVTCRADDPEDADPQWFELVVDASDDGVGPSTVAGAFVDVTDHKLMEQELQNARYELKLALLAGGVGTLSYDLASGSAVSDGVWNAIHGGTAHDLTRNGGEVFYAHVDPRHRALVREALAEAIHSGAPGKWTYRYERPSGSRGWVTVRSVTECDARGAPWRLVLAAVDVTDLKRAEGRLRTQSEICNLLALDLPFEDTVTGALELVCQCEELDGGVLWSDEPETFALRCKSLWLSPRVSSPEVEAEIRLHLYPRMVAFAGRALVGVHDANDPLEALCLRHGLAEQSALPVLAENECVGFLSFVGRKNDPHDRDFTEFMRFVCGQLGLYVRRKAAEAELRRLAAT